jgi:hypothetical protein
VSDELLELIQPSFKFSNISPARLDSSVCTDIRRIALVGCGTDGVNQNLTQDFARAIYNDTPTLKTAEITGRKGDMQINPDGTSNSIM